MSKQGYLLSQANEVRLLQRTSCFSFSEKIRTRRKAPAFLIFSVLSQGYGMSLRENTMIVNMGVY